MDNEKLHLIDNLINAVKMFNEQYPCPKDNKTCQESLCYYACRNSLMLYDNLLKLRKDLENEN